MNSLGIQHRIDALLNEFTQKKKYYLQQPSYSKKRAKSILSSDSPIKLKGKWKIISEQLFSAFEHIKKLQTELENVLIGTITLASCYQQKIRQRDVQCDLNSIELNELKILIQEEKLQKQKLITQFDKKCHDYLQTLDIKQFECRQLRYQIQDLQQQIKELKSQQYQKVMKTIQQEQYQKFMTKGKEQINFLRNQLTQTEYFKDKYKEEKQSLKEKIQYLEDLVNTLNSKIVKQQENQWNFQNFQNQEQVENQNYNNKSFSFKEDQNDSNYFQNYPSRYQLNSSTQMPVVRDILDLTEINSNSHRVLQIFRSKQRSIYDISENQRRSSISKSKSIRKFRLMYTKQKQNFSYNTLLNGSNQNKDLNVKQKTISLDSEEQMSCCQFKPDNEVKTPRGIQQFFTDKNDELFQIELTDTDKIKSYQTNKISQLRQSLKDKKIQQKLIPIDPYEAFFSLTVQCIKLNAKNFNKVISVFFDTPKQYNRVLRDNIPMNLWGKEIKHRLQILLGQQI